LVVTDESVLSSVVELALSHGKYTTRVAATPQDAQDALNDWQPHLALIDMEVGNGQTVSWLGRAAEGPARLPIIALTRRGDLKTKLDAFELGVDDIITVPFSPEELVARVVALVRRSYGDIGNFTPVLELGELRIDILNRSVTAQGHELHLTSLEQNLLYLLAANAGRLLTRDEIIDYLWGTDYAAESNVVDRHVRNLRAKLQNNWRRPRYIKTVPGRGYQFAPHS
jgi:DNA-binding response OmpR family regulator